MGNAYQNASLIVTPNAYKASKIYALKPDDGSGDLSFSRAGSKMVRNSSGLWETIGTNIPPLHYPVGGGCPSWLFEAEATNVQLQSLAFNSYYSDNVVLTTGQTPTAISGQTSTKLTDDATNGLHRIFSVSGGSGICRASIYAKKDTLTQIALAESIGYPNPAIFDLDLGTIISDPYSNASIKDEGNGWYRCSILLTATGLDTVQIRTAKAGTTSYAGTGESLYIQQNQLETGTTATSPIITAGSSVTRLRDVPTGTMIAGTLGYTIVTNVNSLTTTAAIRNFLDLSNGSGRQGILAKSAANKLIFQVYLNGSLVNTVTSTNDLPSGMGKCAVVFNGTTYKIFMDGGIEGTLSAVGGFPNAYGFNDAASSIEQKDLEYYNVALSDSEIVDLITA